MSHVSIPGGTQRKFRVVASRVAFCCLAILLLLLLLLHSSKPAPRPDRAGGEAGAEALDDSTAHLTRVRRLPLPVDPSRGGGGICLRFVDERGNPVPGIGVAVVPPLGGSLGRGGAAGEGTGRPEGEVSLHDWLEVLRLTPDRWERMLDFPPEERPDFMVDLTRAYDSGTLLLDPTLPWTRESDAQGVAQWLGLPEGAGYRWVLSKYAPVVLNPPYEVPEFQFTGNGTIRERSPPHRGLSGPMTVQEGEVAEYTVTVWNQTAVTGVVLSPDLEPARGARLDLINVESHGPPGVPGLRRRVPEANSSADSSGLFFIQNARPGAKILAIKWENGEGTFHVSDLWFDLAAGELKDLGTIVLPRGHCVSFIIEVQGAPMDLVCAAGPPIALVDFTAPSSPGVPRMSLRPIELTAGAPFQICGLPAGEGSAGIIDMVRLDVTHPDYRIEKPPLSEPVRFTIPRADTVVIPLRAYRIYPVEVLLLLDGPGTPRLNGRLLELGGRGEHRLSQGPFGRGQEARVIRGTVRAGRYRLLVDSNFTDFVVEPHEQRNLFGEATIAVPADGRMDEANVSRVEMRLGPGAILRGRGLGSDGSALADEVVVLRIEPGGRQVAFTKTDALGRFIFRGAPPNARMELFSSMGSISRVVETPGPGEELDLGDLRSERRR